MLLYRSSQNAANVRQDLWLQESRMSNVCGVAREIRVVDLVLRPGYIHDHVSRFPKPSRALFDHAKYFGFRGVETGATAYVLDIVVTRYYPSRRAFSSSVRTVFSHSSRDLLNGRKLSQPNCAFPKCNNSFQPTPNLAVATSELRSSHLFCHR